MASCDRRTRAYKNGKTFAECEKIAESMNTKLKQEIEQNAKVLWSRLLEKVDHDELVYKLTLKYLKRDGYDIGDWKTPEIKKMLREY